MRKRRLQPGPDLEALGLAQVQVHQQASRLATAMYDGRLGLRASLLHADSTPPSSVERSLHKRRQHPPGNGAVGHWAPDADGRAQGVDLVLGGLGSAPKACLGGVHGMLS